MEMKNDFRKSLICIEYPGVVNNTDNAIQTLGGINSISKAHSAGTRRLELRFRPQDSFSKAACSTKHHTSALLLRIRVKKKKKNDTSNEPPKVVSTEVVGVVRSIYKFETLSDFQFLPLEPIDPTGKSDKLESIHDKLVPEGLPDPDWLGEPAPLFLVPPVFSRLDTPQSMAFRTAASKEVDDKHPKLIGKMRKKRRCHAVFTNFSHSDPIPLEPNRSAIDKKFQPPPEHIERINKLFEIQPIWSKIALLYVSKLSNNELKIILPRLAFYYLTGPWRILWVKFGCDPRKDPQCRMYQTIDFRVRSAGGLKSFIKASRQSDALSLPFKAYQQARTKGSLFVSGDDNIAAEELDESVYIFRPGVLPPRRQMFYQYCNLKVPEIEEMLGRLGEVLPGALCHERRGWMPSGFEDQCRSILNQNTSEKMRQLVAEKQISSSRDSALSEGIETDDVEDVDNEGEAIDNEGDIPNEDDEDEDENMIEAIGAAEQSEYESEIEDEVDFQEIEDIDLDNAGALVDNEGDN